jgi:hypothetical protein
VRKCMSMCVCVSACVYVTIENVVFCYLNLCQNIDIHL